MTIPKCDICGAGLTAGIVWLPRTCGKIRYDVAVCRTCAKTALGAVKPLKVSVDTFNKK